MKKEKTGTARRSPLVYIALAGIWIYRKIVSPVLHAMFGAEGFCRFTPTCSEYARQAVLEHGFFKGALLAAWRVLRCNPLSAGGSDPVPARGQWRLRRERVGILGGSFDPVHNAHLALAEAARRALRLDRVIFVPAAQSPLKETAPGATAEQRLAMLRAAVSDVPAVEISDWELLRGGKSWSVDTVEFFEKKYPRARFFWILGADQLSLLDRWHNAETLCRKVVFAVMRRDGETLPPVPETLRGIARIEPLDTPPIAMSSTEIRRAVVAGDEKKLRDCVPARVLTIIRENQIYSHAHNAKNDEHESSGKNESEIAARDDEKTGDAQIRADKEYREPCWNDR